ncbi:DgyrCDS2438 [Dimorphilus gyrociliatus]|uniref:alpha-mannosidase n=1 Tax=Dimorphilus gyrociliatus TaxID=2664684 RepID=A0A7I8VAB1_9ANNE|nr:DgyrCDS2438 [Dimorphilus gyrociliatus]
MSMPRYTLKHKRTTLERAEKFISEVYFTDVNLHGKLRKFERNIELIEHYKAPGRITFQQAISNKFNATKLHERFGPTWSTHWFRITLEIPKELQSEDVQLEWDSESEAMIWSEDGRALQGFTGENRRNLFLLPKKSGKQIWFIEMACNGLFGAGNNSQINPPNENKYFELKKCGLVVLNELVHQLCIDYQILIDIVKQLGKSTRSYQALFTLNKMTNIIEVGNDRSYEEARSIAKSFYEEHNGQNIHMIHAVGNCHIDSAWLWPYEETIRKCARSWSSTIRLMEKYPDFTFACSQGQQFEWVKDNYPDIYEEMKKYISEGRFIPIGGTWCELDGNIPSGESYIRQFLIGQRFFRKEFNITCQEFWLPDTFGYSGQLPQLIKLGGMTRFVTQKMSWNIFNKFPHNTFYWIGIDNSKVICHFPPGDSYTMEGKISELIATENNHKDKGRSDRSMYLYGYGDGGQGPTGEMIEVLNRVKDVVGLPKVKYSSPTEFFDEVESFESKNLCEWTGELYLEMHNGTYTTQAKTKLDNRKCEFLLRDVEFLSSLAWLNKSYQYPHEELTRIWKLLLLNQFHDVLPGSSIRIVYEDAAKYYKDIKRSGKKLKDSSLAAFSNEKDNKGSVLINTFGWARKEVVSWSDETIEKADLEQEKIQYDVGESLVLVDIPAFTFNPLSKLDVIQPNESNEVTVTKDEDGNFVMRNSLLTAVIDCVGRVISLKLAGSEREAISQSDPANQFLIFDDIPLYWDAWDVMDYHLETRKTLESAIEYARITESGPIRASLVFALKISDSSYIQQTIKLDALSPMLKFDTIVHWHENRKFLKVEFPLRVHTTCATYETQYGFLNRPNHQNTSWDSAKFEVCGHKWADLSEHGFGVSVLNDCKYGWSTFGNIMRLSLLRSPKAPDETADMGIHHFTYGLMPHSGTFQQANVIQQSYNLNCPLVEVPTKQDVSGKFDIEISENAIILESIKKAEDHDAIVFRFYESHGSHVTTRVKLPKIIKDAKHCNAIEDIFEDECLNFDKENLVIEFTPFQIRSVMIIF